MKYYITTPQIAELISRNEALERGCGPVTKYWWSWIINESDNTQAAVCFNDDETVSYVTTGSLGSEWYPADPE